jgi:hypothetical protein
LSCARDGFAVPLLFCSVLDLILLSNVVKGKRQRAIVEQDYKLEQLFHNKERYSVLSDECVKDSESTAVQQ